MEPSWIYSKAEDSDLNFSSPDGAWRGGVDYVITEDWGLYERWEVKGDQGQRKGWDTVGGVEGLERVRRKGRRGLEVQWAKKVGVLKRKG